MTLRPNQPKVRVTAHVADYVNAVLEQVSLMNQDHKSTTVADLIWDGIYTRYPYLARLMRRHWNGDLTWSEFTEELKKWTHDVDRADDLPF